MKPWFILQLPPPHPAESKRAPHKNDASYRYIRFTAPRRERLLLTPQTVQISSPFLSSPRESRPHPDTRALGTGRVALRTSSLSVGASHGYAVKKFPRHSSERQHITVSAQSWPRPRATPAVRAPSGLRGYWWPSVPSELRRRRRRRVGGGMGGDPLRENAKEPMESRLSDLRA